MPLVAVSALRLEPRAMPLIVEAARLTLVTHPEQVIVTPPANVVAPVILRSLEPTMLSVTSRDCLATSPEKEDEAVVEVAIKFPALAVP